MAIIFLNCKNLASNGSIAGVGGTDSLTGTQNHFTEVEAIAAIDSGSIRFVDRDSAGHHAEVQVSHHGQHRFLETHRDGVKTDNLSRLPILSSRYGPADAGPASISPGPVHRGHCVHAKKLG